jgi:hypothetical protein
VDVNEIDAELGVFDAWKAFLSNAQDNILVSAVYLSDFPHTHSSWSHVEYYLITDCYDRHHWVGWVIGQWVDSIKQQVFIGRLL